MYRYSQQSYRYIKGHYTFVYVVQENILNVNFNSSAFWSAHFEVVACIYCILLLYNIVIIIIILQNCRLVLHIGLTRTREPCIGTTFVCTVCYTDIIFFCKISSAIPTHMRRYIAALTTHKLRRLRPGDHIRISYICIQYAVRTANIM